MSLFDRLVVYGLLMTIAAFLAKLLHRADVIAGVLNGGCIQ